MKKTCWPEMEQSGYLAHVEDGCMKIVQRNVSWTKTTGSVIVLFVLTFYLCTHSVICKYIANSRAHVCITIIFELHYHDTSGYHIVIT